MVSSSSKSEMDVVSAVPRLSDAPSLRVDNQLFYMFFVQTCAIHRYELAPPHASASNNRKAAKISGLGDKRTLKTELYLSLHENTLTYGASER